MLPSAAAPDPRKTPAYQRSKNPIDLRRTLHGSQGEALSLRDRKTHRRATLRITLVLGLEQRRLDVETMGQLIGSKFLVDPSFAIYVNNDLIDLIDLEHAETEKIRVGKLGELTVHFIDASEHTRTARLRGITWWVNRHMVGEPGWDRLDDEGGSRGEVPDVFQYDDIPHELRVQLLFALDDASQRIYQRTIPAYRALGTEGTDCFAEACLVLRRELGTGRLTEDRRRVRYPNESQTTRLRVEFADFFQECDTEHILDAIEVVMHFIEEADRNRLLDHRSSSKTMRCCTRRR
jgi:hypothetical protein